MIRYDLCEADVARFRTGLERMEELLRAAGAREVYLPLPRGVQAAARRARRDLKLMAFHPLGTARADARAERGVVDGDLAAARRATASTSPTARSSRARSASTRS